MDFVLNGIAMTMSSLLSVLSSGARMVFSFSYSDVWGSLCGLVWGAALLWILRSDAGGED